MGRKERRAAQTAKQKLVRVWQVPVVLDRDTENVIGVVTLDPMKVPEGTDWALQAGEKDGKIILFSTFRKGDVGKK